MFSNQKGALPLLVLVAAVGLISLVAVTTTVQFNDQFFSNLFPKPGSFASAPVTPSPAPTSPPFNLLKNPGCELNTLGWVGNNAAILRITNPINIHSGNGVCRVNRSAGTTYGIQEAADATKRELKQGVKYTASAWVKVDTASASGKFVILRLRQAGGATAASNSNSTPVKLTTSWQQIFVSTTINAPDRTNLRLMVLQNNAVVGNHFFVDDLSLVPTPIPQTPNPSPSLSL